MIISLIIHSPCRMSRPPMAPRTDAPTPNTAASVDDREQPHSDEADDDEEEAEEATSSSSPQRANDDDEDDEDDDDDDATITTLLFSDRGTTLPYWTVETDESFNEVVRQRLQLPTWKPDDYQHPTVKQLQVIFDNYRLCIITNTLETYLLLLSWVSHIHDIDSDDDRLAQGAALQDFIRDVEHISDKGEGKKGSLSAVGHRIIVAAYIWKHNPVWHWWDQHRSRVSVKMIASCTVKAITDKFLLGRLMRILMMNEHKAKAEVSQLAKSIVDEDGIAAWDIKKKTLVFNVFHCDDWVEATAQQAKERQWVEAGTLRQHKRWTDICDKKEKTIRALTIVSIGPVAKKAGGVDYFEVQFSSQESLWLSHDNIRALKVKQWVAALDTEVETSDNEEEEENKDEAKEQPRPTPEQQQVVEMEAKLKEEHRLRVQEQQLRVKVEKELKLLRQEREKEHTEQRRWQRLQQREKAKETAQLLDKLGKLSLRMEGELREEVLEVIRALQGAALEKPAEEAKEAPQSPAASQEAEEAGEVKEAEEDEEVKEAEEAKQAPVEAAAAAREADDAAEDKAPAATSLRATGGKRKQVVAYGRASKKQR